jgi:hypothetical protein
MSASPTTGNFYTPAQTPSALGPAPSAIDPPPNETSKKKKSKKKKKTGSKPNGTMSVTTTTENATKEPFHDQLYEIDGIKTASQSEGYQLRSAQGIAEHESRSEEKVRPALVFDTQTL